ncbi:MAG: VOC family protein [Parvularculaceae bacterium]
MIAYSTIGTNDMERARKFYGELLGELGAKEMFVRPDGGFVGFGVAQGQPMFGVAKPYDGGDAAAGNGNMVAIAVKSPDQVKSMYDKAISLGATCEGEPGPRVGGAVTCGYVRDADGNKLNFVCMGS